MMLRALTLLLLLSACGSSPSNHYYALSPEPEGLGDVGSKHFTLGSVTIPTLLDRPQIVLKSGSNEVNILEYNRWAEPLDSMIQHVLAQDLTQRHAQGKITVSIDEFDADENGQVTLKASWSRKATHDPKHLIQHAFAQSEAADGKNIDSIVAGMSHLLGLLADSITDRE